MRQVPRVFAFFIVCLWFSPLARSQCRFVVEPVADMSGYRNEGWELPGVEDGKPLIVTLNGERMTWPGGVTVSAIGHNRSYPHYHVSFPEAVYEDHGVRMKMRPKKVGVVIILQWEVNGKPYAYSYELAPDDVLCTFSVDFVDDKGDGVFRVMNSPGHPLRGRKTQPPAVPDWARKPSS